MRDLFKEISRPVNAEQRLLQAICGDSDKVWLKREEEAREFMSKYIDGHPDELTNAIITVSQLNRRVKSQMEYLREDYLRQNHSGNKEAETENDFSYARMILILGALRMILNGFEEEEGNCFIHLCDKGCEAVRFIRKEKRENKC